MDSKTIRLVAASLFFVAGCGQQPNFTINGKLAGANRDSLVLEEMTAKSLELRSTIITDASGSFNYSDTAGNPRLLFLRTNQNEYITLMVMSGEKIAVTAEKGKINATLRITGSPQSELIMELNKELLKATNKLDSLSKQYQELKGKGNDPQVDTWVQGEYRKLVEQQRSFIRAFIERHVAEPASLLALSHQIGRESVLNGSTDFDLFKKVDAQLYKKYPKSILILNLHTYVEAMLTQMESAQAQNKSTGIGSVAPDISLPDPDRKTQTLSSLRGKIVLLDFWAGWCGPCRRENPNLVAAYSKYHDKGFEIFQVSLDKTKPEWIAAIQKDGLNWIHVSDLKFWSSPVARLYGISSIPANFLLDKEGKIIGSNLRGAALEDELAKLFR
ncbi:MAG: redoxin domain-containing protein [Bacteroidia bacterium]|nr:redoxin domain-containing protein [Bacteroidia bacterium]